MKGKTLAYFRLIVLFLLAFAVFYALNGSRDEDVVLISYNQDKNAIVDQMLEQGFIRKDLSYYLLKIALIFRDDVEPGGYVMKKGLGAVSAALQLKDPEYKFVVINSGQRKGEMAETIGSVLGWNEEKKKEFSTQNYVCEFIGQEGYLAPGKYLIHKDEDPEIIQLKMEESFKRNLEELGINTEEISQRTITTIASLIQKEAAGKEDMRLISGIIWNRLKNDMPLQIDATLQYIKGQEGDWWPMPYAKDKYIDSPLNTYQNKGVPPSPIATPSEAALTAAANPLKTDCLFYLHDKRGVIHCSTDYEGHKRNVESYLK